jgi:hypothetical protein
MPAFFPTSDIDILAAVAVIFSGSTHTAWSIEKQPCALSHDGVCVYFKAFEDLDLLPEEASLVRVVAGSINFEGARYEKICDLANNARSFSSDFGPHISYSLVPSPDQCKHRYNAEDLVVAGLLTVLTTTLH